MTNKNEFLLALGLVGVQGLRPYEPGKPLEELEREYGVTNAIKLASNENPLGPSPAVFEVIGQSLKDLARYPDGNGFALKRKIAQKQGVATDQLTLGNGSNDILELIGRAFLDTQSEVIYSEHAFAVYALVTQATGAKAVVVPALDWGHDLDAMAERINDKTKVIFIANPNNPTGTWLDQVRLKRFIARVPEQVIVVVDEAYHEYIGEKAYGTAISWLTEFPNLVVTRTFSKAYGLAGLRVGYGISHSAIADLLNRVRQPFNVNSLALIAAEHALDDQAHIDKAIELNHSGMHYLCEEFNRLGLDFIPSVGNFVCVRVGKQAKDINEALMRHGVIVRPVANYGMPEYLRITIGLESENSRFIAAMEQILKSINN